MVVIVSKGKIGAKIHNFSNITIDCPRYLFIFLGTLCISGRGQIIIVRL